MKIATKRISSVILCLSMLLSMLLVPVSATGHKTERSGVKVEKTVESKKTRSACTAESGEHSFDDSGACTTCGILALIISMTDSYGDGWSGNAVEVYADGELVGTATLEDGAEATWTGTYDPDKVYKFYWTKGSYSEECSFEILFGSEERYAAQSSDCDNFKNGELVYNSCTHSYDDGVYAAPTCTEVGGVFYTCSNCSEYYVVDEEAALGHDFGDDGKCTVCGAAPSITINMTDSYGDSWSGNAVEVYADGELVGTATIETGSEATWTCEYDLDKEYTFYWIEGEYASECAFTIYIGDEFFFEAVAGDCAEIGTGAQFTADGIIPGESGGGEAPDEDTSFSIVMEDAAENGWGGCGIEVYADGERLGVLTLEEGGQYQGNFAVYSPDVVYEFYWVAGEAPEECAFAIILGEQVLYVAMPETCAEFTDGQLIFSTESLGEEEEDDEVVYVAGVALNSGEYLDLEGNVTTTRPYSGYAHYVGNTLTLNHFSYTGTPTVTIVGQAVPVFIYTPRDTLEIQLWGENTFVLPDETPGYGIIVGNPMQVLEMGALTVSGNGILNMSGDALFAIMANDITLNSGVVNFNAYRGPASSNGDATVTVNGGDLIIDATSSPDDDSYALNMGHITINGGRVILASNEYAITGSTLTVDGGCLEVKQGVLSLYDPYTTERITLGEGISITSPEGAKFGTFTNINDLVMQTICNADGTVADAFVIKGEEQIIPVEVVNDYGVADTVTLSNPNAVVGQNYITTVSASVGTDIGVWSVYIPQEDAWYGNGAFYFNEDTNTLTVFADYVTEGLKIDVTPFVTLTTHLNGGSVNEVWQSTYEPDENGTFTVECYCGYNDYIFVGRDGETDEMIPDANLIFEREGYTVVGYNTAADGSGTDYAMDTKYMLTEDTEIYLIWKSTDATSYNWKQIDGEWYYVDPESGEKVTGLSRVPYPTEEIDGITYAPDQEAIDYYAGKNETFIDETEGWFCFNEDGVFQSDFNGMIETDDKNIYAENGFAVWNPGLVELDDGYYYFIGDTENGGNKPAVGNYYVGKNNTDFDITLGGVYTFDEDGKLCEYDGITDVGGTLYYYEDYQLMMGAGLIATGGSFYYVRSDGSLVVGQRYWVANTNGYKVSVGEYEFADDGKLIFPESMNKNGIYLERGAWYYYENGKKAYGKGLINTTLNWYDENGELYWSEGGIIYVRSDGRLATGRYYITNIDNFDGMFDAHRGMVLNFNELGLYIAPKNGIYEIDGVLRYFINDVMQYNSGIIVVDDNYYYVRSNGVVVSECTYWVTNVGSSGVVAGAYVFDENGVMQDPKFAGEPVLNGIANGYFYENGNIAYNKGLTYLEAEGCYIYVRSNGMIATGKYWITNHNDLLTAGLYDFGEDGKLFR